jgi:hypothetical protein
MPWPDHQTTTDPIPASAYLADIIATCQFRLNSVVVGHHYHRLILGHALLDLANHTHGELRGLVRPDGNGVNHAADLDAAHENVRRAHVIVVQSTPLAIADLVLALAYIDHSGGKRHDRRSGRASRKRGDA